jgi:hypothetical protein
MVEIKTNDGVVLELAAGSKMGLQYNSPFFTDVLGNAEYSLPIKLVGSGNNKIAMDFFDRIKSSNRAVSFGNITLKDNGTKVAQDLSLYVDSVQGNLNNGNCTFEGQLIGAKDAFLVWLGSDVDGNTNKKLADVATLKQMMARPSSAPIQFSSPMSVALWATDVVLNPSGTPHICFPSYYVPNWTTDDYSTPLGLTLHFGFNGMINAWDDSNNTMRSDTLSGSTLTINDIVPMFKTYWVIEQIMADAGYAIDYAPIFSDADFLKHYVFNTVSVIPYGNGILEFGGFYISPANHLPDMLVEDWLNDMGLLFGMKFIFKNDMKVDIVRFNDLLATTDYDDWTNKADANFLKKGVGADLVGIELNYGNQSSENLLGDVLKNLDSVLSLIDAGTYITVANKAALGTYTSGTLILVKSENYWYQTQSDLTNLFLGDNLQRLKILNAKTVYSSSTITHNTVTNNLASPPVRQLESDVARGFINVFVKGYSLGGGTLYVSYYLGSNPQPFVSAIGIYHGLQNTLTGSNAITLGSSNNYAPDSTTKLSAWHLGWLGEEGLYETFWKAWASFIVKMVTVQFPMYLDANDLANLDYSKKIRINGVNYFLKSLKVEFPFESGKQTGEFVLAEGIDL